MTTTTAAPGMQFFVLRVASNKEDRVREALAERRVVLFRDVEAWKRKTKGRSELIRYLEHPKSGALDFSDMSSSWVPVREALAAHDGPEGVRLDSAAWIVTARA